MHRESVTEALLGTVLVFNTVFTIPPDMGLFGQIFGVAVVFGLILSAIETARDWEQRIKKKSAGRQPKRTNNKLFYKSIMDRIGGKVKRNE